MQQPNEALPLSPVHSLAVHHQALWLLSGTESGPINLQSVRHEEGKRITSLFKHENAVSVMSLSRDQVSMLSGSWDKSVFDWDLNTGQVRREFVKSSGQISALEMRPESRVPIHQESLNLQDVSTHGTFSSSNDASSSNDLLSAGVGTVSANGEDAPNGIKSPTNSLFDVGGDHDSLFGDDDQPGASDIGFGDDGNDPLSKALHSELKEAEKSKIGGDTQLLSGENFTDLLPPPGPNDQSQDQILESRPGQSSRPALNRATHVEDFADHPAEASTGAAIPPDQQDVSENTFLDASIEGTLRIWDRRRPSPITRIVPPRNVPPWCMHASWSPDGNYIYAGRRNGTVDQYSVHKGLREPVRTLKFPAGSGAVSAVRAMPNNRHIVW